jgi:hypothetical protein
MITNNLYFGLDSNSFKRNGEQLDTLSFSVLSEMVKDDRRKNVTERKLRGDKNLENVFCYTGTKDSTRSNNTNIAKWNGVLRADVDFHNDELSVSEQNAYAEEIKQSLKDYFETYKPNNYIAPILLSLSASHRGICLLCYCNIDGMDIEHISKFRLACIYLMYNYIVHAVNACSSELRAYIAKNSKEVYDMNAVDSISFYLPYDSDAVIYDYADRFTKINVTDAFDNKIINTIEAGDKKSVVSRSTKNVNNTKYIASMQNGEQWITVDSVNIEKGKRYSSITMKNAERNIVFPFFVRAISDKLISESDAENFIREIGELSSKDIRNGNVTKMLNAYAHTKKCNYTYSAIKMLQSTGLDIQWHSDNTGKGDGVKVNIAKMIADSLRTKRPYRNFTGTEYTLDYKSETNGYLSNILDDSSFVSGVNMLYAPAGCGKTSFFEGLSQTKRIVIIEPMKSIVRAKSCNNGISYIFEKSQATNFVDDNKSIMIYADAFLDINRKFTSKVDYVVLDECHVIGQQLNFRERLISLINVINALDKDIKIVCMTGTPDSVDKMFDVKNNIVVRYNETNKRNKVLVHHTVSCDSARYTELAKEAIRVMDCKDKDENGNYKRGKVLCPVKDKEDAIIIYSLIKHYRKEKIDIEKISEYVENNLYSTSTKNVAYDKINSLSEMDDEITFCTTYLSVGIDIKNGKYDEIMTMGDFNANELEQFANRFRQNDIKIHKFVSKAAKRSEYDCNSKPAYRYLYAKPDCFKHFGDMAKKKREGNSEYSDDAVLSPRHDSTGDCVLITSSIETAYKELLNESEYNRQELVVINDMKYKYNYKIVIRDSTNVDDFSEIEVKKVSKNIKKIERRNTAKVLLEQRGSLMINSIMTGHNMLGIGKEQSVISSYIASEVNAYNNRNKTTDAEKDQLYNDSMKDILNANGTINKSKCYRNRKLNNIIYNIRFDMEQYKIEWVCANAISQLDTDDYDTAVSSVMVLFESNNESKQAAMKFIKLVFERGKGSQENKKKFTLNKRFNIFYNTAKAVFNRAVA